MSNVKPSVAKSLGVLQRRLGYRFQDEGKLRSALTHKSAGADNFERLEFLGDAALGFIVGRKLFDAAPEAGEHRLTLMRASLVNATALANLAREIDLGAFLKLGEGERKSGGAKRDSILADAFEATLGAIVCDGGVEAATVTTLRLLESRLHRLGDEDLRDPKTRLQEYLQARRLPLPRYEVASTAGRDHTLVFSVACAVDKLGIRGNGTGGSRRAAEKVAAAEVLQHLLGSSGEPEREQQADTHTRPAHSPAKGDGVSPSTET